MGARRPVRPALLWSALAVALLCVLGALLALLGAALIDAGYFRATFIALLAAQAGRPIAIEGSMHSRLLSLQPQLEAERVTIGNPPWMPAGTLAQIGRLNLQLRRWPVFGRELEILRLEIDDATLQPVRDEQGRANWHWTAPHQGAGGLGPPLIHSLSLSRSRVLLEDQRRHLKFDGTAAAYSVHLGMAAEPWHLEGAGELNGRAATFALNGDALSTVSHERPYRFAFAERSSGTRLQARGELPRPFDFHALEISFEAAGEDLRDLYFLTGVTLPDTAGYRLSGKLTRARSHFQYSDLVINSGQSDLRGTLSIETAGGHTRLEANLDSLALHWSDIGARAAGRAPPELSAELKLFPTTPLPLEAVRHGDVTADYHARKLTIGREELRDAAARIRIEQGTLTISPLSAVLPAGRIAGRLKLEAAPEVPRGQIDLSIADLRISQFDHKHPQAPAFDGLLQARLQLTGRGSSLHALASSAEGTVTAVLPKGTIRASFAELAGMDLARGLGLLLGKSDQEAPIRCAIAGFRAHEGSLSAQQILIDTGPVLIRGEGEIHLDSEALDLSLTGEPKSRRMLRLHEPILIRGTLEHPTIGLQPGRTALQTGKALAEGIVRTPLEVLGFVDPGLASNADCAALLSQARQQGVTVKPAPAPQ